MRRPALAVLAALVIAGGVAACSDEGPSDGRLAVEASFYPLQWVSEAVGGDRVEVRSLTKPGGEPHDLELLARDVGAMEDADLVVYLHGFQPAVDAAVGDVARDHAYDVAQAARLTRTFTPIEDGQRATEEAGSTDPHFWLDPTRLARVGRAVADRLAALDPQHAAGYRDRAAALGRRLSALDAQLRRGLADCRQQDLVTSHNAFGYFAERYGLRQVGITGLTPDDEPSPADLARVARFVRRNDVRTVYVETLVPKAIARTVAAEAGARTAVLDPIEGITDESAGRDYPAVMRANLRTLRAGQDCA